MLYAHMHGGRWYWTHDNKDMGLVPTYVLLQKQVISGVRSLTLNHLTCPNSYHAGYRAWREMILNPQQGYGPGAYTRLASETSYYWSRSPTLVTMEPFTNSYHAGYSPGGRWYWTHNNKDMGLYTGLDTPLPFPLPHTHMYDNIRMISTIAFCVLLSSFSSFLAISRLRSLNKEDDENIILLITYDMQRQKGKA